MRDTAHQGTGRGKTVSLWDRSTVTVRESEESEVLVLGLFEETFNESNTRREYRRVLPNPVYHRQSKDVTFEWQKDVVLNC